MSFLIKPAENVIIKRNSIKFDDRFKVSYHNFYRQKKYEHIREILSKDIFFERIAFQISHAISYPHIENPFADKVSQLLYADIIDIFEFPNKHSLPKILRDIELDQQIYDIRAFEDLNLLKYKLFNNHFSANVSLCDDLFLEFMKRPNTLWKETKDLGYAIDTKKNLSYAYLLFIFLTTPYELYLVADKFSLEFKIIQAESLKNEIEEYSIVIPLRGFLEVIFKSEDLEQFKHIRAKYGEKKGKEVNIMQDILNCIDIDKAFLTASFSGQLKGGRFTNLDVVAYSNNIDTHQRRKKLGRYKRIETIYEDDKSVGVKVTKKHKY